MPIYDFECRCGKVSEHYAKIDEKELPCECGKMMKRLITTRYNVHPDFEPYLDEHIGTEPVWVKSKQHRKQLMKEYGVRDYYS